VIVVIDALRADRVGAMGGGKDVTPNLNELAAESVTFTNSFTNINATDPAVTSLQTGRYPLSHGVVNHGKRVTDEEKVAVENVPQLPEILSDAGYDTAAFGRPMGRWHKNGFKEYPGDNKKPERRDGASLRHRMGSFLQYMHPSVQDFAATVYNRTLAHVETKTQQTERDQGSRSGTEEAIRNFKAFLDESELFYAFIHLLDTHITYEPDPDIVKEYLDRFNYTPKDWTGSASRDTYNRGFDSLIKEEEYPDVAKKYYSEGGPTSAVADAHYDAAAHEADQYVGHIVEELKERGIFDETVFVVLSDHGESLTEHGIYYDHHGLYDVSMKIPLIIRPPDGAPETGTVDDLVQITDVAPTVASYADVNGLESDGKPLKPVIEGKGIVDRDFVMAEEAHTQRRRMIRTEEEKLIYLVEGDTVCRYCDVQHAPETEFYDLVDDPGEENNLWKSREERVSELREKAEAAATSYEERRVEGSPYEEVEYEDEEVVRKRLEDLGYK